jgi:hypothetical protein
MSALSQQCGSRAEALRQGTAFLLRSQIKGGRMTGGVPISIPPRKKTARVRIDFVQHAMSAWTAMLRVLPPTAGTGRCVGGECTRK